MSEYKDSLDQGADNVARLGSDVARQLINNHRNKNDAQQESGSSDGNSNAHDAPNSPDAPDKDFPPDNKMDPGNIENAPSMRGEGMGGINPGIDASNGASVPQSAGSASAGAGASGAELGNSATDAGTGTANTGAGANAAGAGGGATAGSGSAAAGGSSAGSSAASTGSTAAGGSGCAVCAIIILIIAVVCFVIAMIIGICFSCSTYSDESVLNKESTSATMSSVTITADTLNVRSAAGTNSDKIGKVYKNATYTYLGQSKDSNGNVWYKIQYTATTAGWISSSYATVSESGGGNSTVELANSVLVYLAEDCSDSIAAAKADVKKKDSVYGGKIKLSGSNEMGGPEGGSATSDREYEYFINDGGITASYNDTSEGSMEIDVPYIMAAFAVYMERNNDVLDLTTASSDEVWAEFKKVLDDMLDGTHTYEVTSKTRTYSIPNPNYGEVIDSERIYNYETGEYDTTYTYDTNKTTTNTGKYYTYNIYREEIEVTVYNYFSDFSEDEWELVDAKTVFMAQLLYELGGLCYTSTFDSSDSLLSNDDGYDIEIKYDGGTGRFAWAVPSSKRISSPFGMRYHPVSKKYKMHKGIDIAASMGSDVIAAADGKVIKVLKSCSHNNSYCCDCGGGYGNYIFIQHSDGYVTRYAHLTSVKVKVGQQVSRGQVIATVGTTGVSTGPHLHFEVRKNGTPVDPQQFY